MGAIELCNGIKAKFSDMVEGYWCQIDWDEDLEVELVLSSGGNEKAVPKLQDLFKKIWEDRATWKKTWEDSIRNFLLPYLNKYPDALEDEITPEMFEEDFELENIYIIEDEMEDEVQVSFIRFGEGIEDDDVICLRGTLEKGFNEFYLNGTPIHFENELSPVILSNGTRLKYSSKEDAFTGLVDFNGVRDVLLYLQVNRDLKSGKEGAGYFEKILKEAEAWDQEATGFIGRHLGRRIKKLREEHNMPFVEAEDILEVMVLDSISINDQGAVTMVYTDYDIFEDTEFCAEGTFYKGFYHFYMRDPDRYGSD